MQRQRTLSPQVLGPDGTVVTRKYTLIEELGRGANGTVWRARAHTTGREYAIKILHADQVSAPKALARFLQERTILLKLRHPNLVAVHDLLTTNDGAPALVLDLVTGGTLREFLRERRTLPPAEAARLLGQVASALAAAHAHGIVHRDLKPDNILLAPLMDGSIQARLTDFGIARLPGSSNNLTTTGAVLGTPNYMAPEVIEGRPATEAADVYALGILLYELLVGRPPFDDECDTVILLRHTRAAPKPVTGIPVRFWALIESCLDRNTQRRPDAAALVDTLASLADESTGLPASPPRPRGTYLPADEPSAQESAPPVPQQRRRRWKRSAIAATTAVVLLMVIAAGGYLVTRHGGTGHNADTAAAATAPPPTEAESGAGGAGVPVVDDSGVAAAGPAAATSGVPSSGPPPRMAAPAGGTPEGYGPWRCADFRWALMHPVLGKTCNATGPSVRILATLKAAPGAQTDVSIAVQNTATDQVVGGPFTCAGLKYTETAPEQSCGPFAVDLPKGGKYRVIATWKYTDAGIVPGGAVRGDTFEW
ncbi:hypothetical protein Val02_68500 [Virgisporangium aliadipatigenens]|uniref:non-specific serine/threonine protein kinase n=1 Tax=Virgisporangium aliadipatigenens TaxID=741659 RepID=A0A8J3YQS5_9ACTN|nr:serine/threonine-protein kinase [Virgisporangium aliadipatigenens]GIJ49964.1 hypothetical protein Val02_68500 [Virgisporangium aliadipatigenens]